MGEAPPYTQGQLLDLVSGLTIVGVRFTSDSVVFLTLERNGNDVEVEVHATPHVQYGEERAEVTVYVRGRELSDE